MQLLIHTCETAALFRRFLVLGMNSDLTTYILINNNKKGSGEPIKSHEKYPRCRIGLALTNLDINLPQIFHCYPFKTGITYILIQGRNFTQKLALFLK